MKFEGGANEGAKNDDNKSKKSNKSSKKEDPEDQYHCCCTYNKALWVYGALLWVFGIFLVVNACLILGNMYMPIYYGLMSVAVALVFLAGLILIAAWACKDTEGSRVCLVIGGWLIFGSILVLILLNAFFVWTYNKSHKE